MVVFNEVARRHILYTFSVISVVMFSNEWTVCCPLLCILSFALKKHSGTKFIFLFSAAFFFTTMEVFMLKFGVRTMRYDYAMKNIGIPLWLLPWWVVRVHWVLDIYCLFGILQKIGVEKGPESVV